MSEQANKQVIMIIDDTPANLEILEEILGARGHEVIAFPQGQLALNAALEDPPDLILLDIMMPTMDGFEVCRRLKASEHLRDIPVIFISALDDKANKIEAFSKGGVDYVTKPFQEAEICARVETHLKLRLSQIELKKTNDSLQALVEAKVKEIADSQMATLVAISNLSEFRDDDTGRHVERTRTFCRILAEKLMENPRYAFHINNEFVRDIYHAAPLHDIGKIGIPDNILLKPGKLTPSEFEIMKTHTSIGAVTLQRVLNSYPNNSFIEMGMAITKFHHEKWNGTGYPDGLKGDEIPLSARIMALADVYDALRSKRPYKKEFSHEESVVFIREGIGIHFDAGIGKAFLSINEQFADTYGRLNDSDGVKGIDL